MGSAAGLQLPDPQKEQGHLELADTMQPTILVACGGQQHKAYTPDQIYL